MSSENTENDTWENRYRVAMNELWAAVNDTTPGTEVDVDALAAGAAFAAEMRQGLTAGLLSPSIYQAHYRPRQDDEQRAACSELPGCRGDRHSDSCEFAIALSEETGR